MARASSARRTFALTYFRSVPAVRKDLIAYQKFATTKNVLMVSMARHALQMPIARVIFATLMCAQLRPRWVPHVPTVMVVSQASATTNCVPTEPTALLATRMLIARVNIARTMCAP